MRNDNYRPMHMTPEVGILEGNKGIGRYVFTPGGIGRARKIAEYLDDMRIIPGIREEHPTFIGNYQGIDVAAIPSGMGPSSASILYGEMIKCHNAKRILRIGSAGSLTEKVNTGDVVIVTGAVKDESVSDTIVPHRYPAIPHPIPLASSLTAATDLDYVFKGKAHTKASFNREWCWGPNGMHNEMYMRKLMANNIIATSMEESVLFTFASYITLEKLPEEWDLGQSDVQAGSILAIVGGFVDGKYAPFDGNLDSIHEAEQRAIHLGLDTVVNWAMQDKLDQS